MAESELSGTKLAAWVVEGKVYDSRVLNIGRVMCWTSMAYYCTKMVMDSLEALLRMAWRFVVLRCAVGA